MLNGKLRRVKPCFCGDEPLCTTKKREESRFNFLRFVFFLIFYDVFSVNKFHFLILDRFPQSKICATILKFSLRYVQILPFMESYHTEKFRGQHKVADHIKAAANS